jgi:DNA cross-link repair 1A protein
MYLPQFDIKIDDFTPGAGVYFLTHFHGDHLRGLKTHWRGDLYGPGLIYTSSITARLLSHLVGVRPELIKSVEPGQSFAIETGGKRVSIQAFDANHCPGALMLLFESEGKRIFYTGDFRLSDQMRQGLALYAPFDLLYIDSTYTHPRYRFPPQEEALAQIVQKVEENLDREIFFGIYTIGKNRVIKAVYEKFGQPIYMPTDKRRVYEALGASHMVTSHKAATNFRAYSRGYFHRYFSMSRRRRFLVIIPTGWAVDYKNTREGFFYVPYSEHCDYWERKEFIELLQPQQIIEI